jgi:hypothetical protein
MNVFSECFGFPCQFSFHRLLILSTSIIIIFIRGWYNGRRTKRTQSHTTSWIKESKPKFLIINSCTKLPSTDPLSSRTTHGTVTFKDFFFSKYYIRIQSVPHRKHITSPLQSPTGYCCLGKQSLFIVRTYGTHRHTLWAECRVQYVRADDTYSNHWALWG